MYTTRQAAERTGISFRTLNRWIAQGKIRAPRVRSLGAVKARLWTDEDLAKLLRDVPKLRNKSDNGRKKKGKKAKRA